MNTEEVHFLRIQWAGSWMITRTRVSEFKIRLKHPETVRIEQSKQLLLTPETPQERMQVAVKTRNGSPDVSYRA